MDETVDQLDADLSIDAGLSEELSYSATDGATVYVKRPERPPLSANETHLSLKVVTDDVNAIIRFDGEEFDGLVDAVTHAQTFHREADR